MTPSRRLIAFILIIGTIIASVAVWFRSRRSDSSQLLQQPAATNFVATVQTPRTSPQVGKRPLYGKASLSEEEKRILYTSFKDMHVYIHGGDGLWHKRLDARKTIPQAYRIGMICLKHRLNWFEVQEMLHLITGEPIPPRDKPPNENSQYLEIALYTHLIFRFDQKGNLESIWTPGTLWYKLPPLDQVKPDTSIDPPQKPADWGT